MIGLDHELNFFGRENNGTNVLGAKKKRLAILLQ